jgi:acetyl esterase
MTAWLYASFAAHAGARYYKLLVRKIYCHVLFRAINTAEGSAAEPHADTMPVDPCFAVLLGNPRNATRPPPPGVPLEKVRRAANAFMLLAPRPEIHAVENMFADGPAGPLALRLYRPDAMNALPVILFIHGGGFVFGDLETHDGLCRTLAREAGAAVMAVNYRLAPETRFPGAVEDCFAALRFVAREGQRLGVDPARIAICGDSAGGALAAATALLAREHGPHLRCIALICPTVDPHCASPSQTEFANGHILTRDALRWFWASTLGDSASSQTAAAHLLTADLGGLPPTCLATAEFDPLRDEGEALADRLHAAGCAVTRRRYAGMIHGFVLMPQITPMAQKAICETGAAIHAALAP